MLRALDRGLAFVEKVAMWLALPMALLLFLQWPLREVLGAWSREANDAAQVVFALYVAVAVTAATRRGVHVATDAIAARYRPGTRRRIARAGSLLVLVPWAAFVLVTAWPATVRSVLLLEGFPETFNPGYFMIRVALVVLAALVLFEALRDAFARDGRHPR
ncbi:MAG: TRAP transporter small permease subunit [Burkholderiales bacterium]